MSYENLKPHYYKGLPRRKPLKRTPFKPKKGKTWKKLSPISKNKERRARRFVPESVRRYVVDVRAKGICEFVDMCGIRCHFPAQRQPHHRKKRSQGGKHTRENLAATCAWHNEWAERFKKEAVEIGWTIL